MAAFLGFTDETRVDLYIYISRLSKESRYGGKDKVNLQPCLLSYSQRQKLNTWLINLTEMNQLRKIDQAPEWTRQCIRFTGWYFGGFSSPFCLYAFFWRTCFFYYYYFRIQWARLKLSFKKLKLFVPTITALGVRHKVGGMIRILESRIEWTIHWPVPKDITGVCSFISALGITLEMGQEFFRNSQAPPCTACSGMCPVQTGRIRTNILWHPQNRVLIDSCHEWHCLGISFWFLYLFIKICNRSTKGGSCGGRKQGMGRARHLP